MIHHAKKKVALRKESVDRNNSRIARRQPRVTSLSARRAWIEITRYISSQRSRSVALRKESVDRNYCRGYPCNTCYRSLSARRAWIEISSLDDILAGVKSLSARRAWIEISVKDLNAHLYYRRSPQGERG